MPQFWENMESGRIVRWLKKEGESIEKGEPIAEVETEKVTAEIEAPQNGILAKILAKEGDKIPVLQTIAIVAMPGELFDKELFFGESGPKLLEVEKFAGLTGPSAAIERPVERVPISPVARRLAREFGIDLAGIKGSGPAGRITMADVTKKIGTAVSQREPEHAKLVPMSNMRRAIAERMSYSARTAPQVTVTAEVDMSEVVKLREKLLPQFEAIGLRLSCTDILVKASAIALSEQPIFNSRLEGNRIRLIDEVNLGVAVEVEDGLIVPVVHGADEKTLAQISRDTKRLIDGAKEGKLSSSELIGGTFTISNLGHYGVDSFTPLINPPETAILGAGRIIEKPVVANGEVKIRPMMFLSLSFDHRVIDGAQAARFLQRIEQILLSPSMLAKASPDAEDHIA
jgi:pyruvate dehydrogenase E2 component (dihydrolipoamide acetyltransferase)